MAAKNELPEENESQRIGQMAVLTLGARHPTSWRVKSLEGTDDFGLDFQVQIVSRNAAGKSQARNIFRLQLKGTESPELSADGTLLSIDLKGSTVRFYDKMTEPVLLVVCDLSIDKDDPRNCPAYWVWIHDEIKRRREQDNSVIDDNASITFNVPVANTLTPAFDANPEVERTRALLAVAQRLDKTVESTAPSMLPEERPAYAEKIVRGVGNHSPSLLEALSAPAQSPWPTAPAGSLASKLDRASDALKSGDEVEAQRLLTSVDAEIVNAKPIEQAEHAFLSGRIASLRNDDLGASELYRSAYNLSKVPKHLAAYGESSLRQALNTDDAPVMERLLTELAGDDPDLVTLRARILATLKRPDEAGKLLDTIPADKAATTKAINALIAQDWPLLKTLCEDGLRETEAGRGQKSLYELLRSRALFHLAIGSTGKETDFDEIPACGPAGLDVELLRECWSAIQVAIELMSESGWPENTNLLGDIWASTSVMLGYERETLPVLRAAANARPHMTHLQAALEMVAFHANEFEAALEANKRLQDDVEARFRRVFIHFQAKQYRECLQYLDAQLSGLPTDNVRYPAVLGIGISAADRLIRPDRAKELEALLAAHPAADEHLATLAYARSIRQDGLPSDEAVKALGDAFARNPKAVGLGLQYLYVLNVMTQDGADRAIATAEHIRATTLLPSDVELHIAQAYVTKQQWGDLLRLGEAGQQRFPLLSRFIAVQAFALDKLGRSDDARKKLDDMLTAGDLDALAVQTYVQICARSGFVDDAIRIVEEIIGREQDKPKRLEYLRLLYDLVNSQEPASARCEQIAWSIGELVDRKSEQQEGTFLSIYMLHFTAGGDADDRRKQEFVARREAYVAAFPNSRIINQFNAPEKFTLEALEEILERIDPGFRKRHENRAHLEKVLEQGNVPIPFVWRPRAFLENVPDVPSLWRLGISSIASAPKFHLQMLSGNWTPVTAAQVAARTPLLDFPALLVINELGMFGVLFQVFERVAVSQATFEQLRRISAPMAGTWGRDICLSITKALKENFARVICPASPQPDEDDEEDDVRSSQRTSDEILRHAKRGDFMLYSDDEIFRFFAQVPPEHQPVFCTMDLLTIADQRGFLSVQEIGKAIGKLCKWNVGGVIPDRYLFAAIPEGVLAERSLARKIDALIADEVSGPIFSQIWNIRRPYPSLLANGGRLAANWIGNLGNELSTVKALLGVWFTKTKFHKSLASLPPLKQIAQVMIAASRHLEGATPDIARRIWEVYLALVEYFHGNRMDEAKESDAYELMGTSVANVEIDLTRKGTKNNRLYAFLASGLTEGTSVQEKVSEAYKRQWATSAVDANAQAERGGTRRR